MNINFKTRDKARAFAQKRNASGYPSKIVDNGKEATRRYSVDIHVNKAKS